MTSPLVTAAAEYLNLGLAVIALTGKTPNVRVHKHGLHEPLRGAPDPSDYDGVLAEVFNHPDTTGIAIVIEYPYVAVDIDGEEGAQQWVDIVGSQYVIDSGPAAKTPRLPAGGLHLWFACPTPTGSIKLGSKLDLKGQASYVAAPPSLHPDGGTYQWLVPWGPIDWVPEALNTIIEDHAFDLQGKLDAKLIRRQAWGPKFVEGDHKFYAQASHDALISGMSTALDGNRNNYLHWAAATLAEEGGSDEEFNQLAEAALAVGLLHVEVKRTVRSARRLNV